MKKRKAKKRPRSTVARANVALFHELEQRRLDAEQRCVFAQKEQKRLRDVIDLHDQQWRTRTAKSEQELETAKALIRSIYEAIEGNQLWTLFRAIQQVVNRG